MSFDSQIKAFGGELHGPVHSGSSAATMAAQRFLEQWDEEDSSRLRQERITRRKPQGWGRR